ncbi:MAG: porin family protein [Alphaproteobacteria bacterium]|nr:porin family protein [Alphaproteobacteria bacterium]
MTDSRRLRVLAATMAAIGLGLVSGAAFAHDRPGTYMQFSTGGIFAEGRDGRGDNRLEYEPDMLYGFALGHRFSPYLRLEGDFTFGRMDYRRVTSAGQTRRLKGEQDFYSFTGNVFLDFPVNRTFTPYLGGGAGAALIDPDGLRLNSARISGESGVHFTALGEAGLAVNLNESVALVPSYRFQWFDNGARGFEDDRVHMLRIGARIQF